MRSRVIKLALSLSLLCGSLMVASSANAVVLKNWNSGLCLAPWGGNSDPGTPVIQWSCDGSTSQIWAPAWSGPPYEVIKNWPENLCIGVEGASTNNGARLILWNCNGSNDQKWQFIERRDHTYPGYSWCYNIVNVNSGKYMTIPMSSTEPSEVIQYASSASLTADAFWCAKDQIIF